VHIGKYHAANFERLDFRRVSLRRTRHRIDELCRTLRVRPIDHFDALQRSSVRRGAAAPPAAPAAANPKTQTNAPFFMCRIPGYSLTAVQRE